MRQRLVTVRPRVRCRRGIAPAGETRRAIDLTHVSCEADSWRHLAALIDVHDGEIVGCEFCHIIKGAGISRVKLATS